MFGGIGKMISGLVDVKGQVASVIQNFLKKIAEEENLAFDNLFVMIRPSDAEFNLKFFIYTIKPGQAPKLLREVTLDEILNSDES